MKYCKIVLILLVCIKLDAMHPLDEFCLKKIAGIESSLPFDCYNALPPTQIMTIALGLKERQQNCNLMVKLLEYCISYGMPEAYYTLAMVFQEGKMLQIDQEKAHQLFTQAALRGHRKAAYFISKRLLERGCYQEAAYWQTQACIPEHSFKVSNSSIQERYLWDIPALSFREDIYAGNYGTEAYQALETMYSAQDKFSQLFDQGCKKYQQKLYKEAYDTFLFLAQHKHPLAMYMIAVCYDTGHGIAQDKVYAEKYYKLSADLGYSVAQDIYTARWVTPESACNTKDRSTLVRQILSYLQDTQGPFYKQGISLCRELIKKDYALEPLLKEMGILDLLHNYSAAGDIQALSLLGKYYLAIHECRDIDKGIEYLKRAAEQLEPEAQILLAQLLVEGKYLKQDYKEALKLFEAVHDQGHILGIYYLAVAYEQGLLVEKDLGKALKLMNDSKLDNFIPALCFRAFMKIQDHRSWVFGTEEALKKLKLYARQNSPEANLTLGIIYCCNSKQNNLRKAHDYLQKAASSGYGNMACGFLGRMYYYGEGVEVDQPRGIEYLEKSVEHNDTSAIITLADIYFNQKQYTKAIDYYKKDLPNKNYHAAACLAICYARGLGVQADLLQAMRYIIDSIKYGGIVQGVFQSDAVREILSILIYQLHAHVKKGELWALRMLGVLKALTIQKGITWQEVNIGTVIHGSNNTKRFSNFC